MPQITDVAVADHDHILLVQRAISLRKNTLQAAMVILE